MVFSGECARAGGIADSSDNSKFYNAISKKTLPKNSASG
jgi:hypothetical protein